MAEWISANFATLLSDSVWFSLFVEYFGEVLRQESSYLLLNNYIMLIRWFYWLELVATLLLFLGHVYRFSLTSGLDADKI